MDPLIGVVLALIALVCWGVGDFLIQRAARVSGTAETMICVGLAFLFLSYPFVHGELFSILPEDLFLLIATATILTLASLFDFEALRQGKMAIAEPVIGLETPLTVLLAVLIAGERLTWLQAGLVIVIFIGTMLIVTKRLSLLSYHRRTLEKGLSMAVLAAIGIALSNFFIGETSRLASPFLVIWWIGVMHLVICGFYVVYRAQVPKLIRDLKAHAGTLVSLSVIDAIAWISFATAALYIPISISTAISSGYIALAVFLGIFITREKIRPHQGVGIAVVCFGIIALSYLFG